MKIEKRRRQNMGTVGFGENGQKTISKEDAIASFQHFMQEQGESMEETHLHASIWGNELRLWMTKAKVGDFFDTTLTGHATVEKNILPDGTVPVTIYGASDDLFKLDTPDDSIYEEYDCYGETVVRLEAPNGETFDVYGVYGRGPTDWAVGPYGDNNANWNWETSQRPDNDMDPAIIVHAPIGTTATLISEG